MNLQPNVGRVLVKVGVLSEKSAGGLFIPESARDTGGAKVADVVSVGPEKRVGGEVTGLSLKVGDKVLIDPLGATKVKLLGDDLLLLRIEDVMGKIEE